MPEEQATTSTVWEEQRYQLQSTLGQLHGLLHHAVENSSQWCDPALVGDIANAYKDLGSTVGEIHAALNSGALDGKLEGIGLGGIQFVPKQEGLRAAIRRLAGKIDGGWGAAIKSGLRWGRTITGSLARELPSAEVVAEFIDVIQNAWEDGDAFKLTDNTAGDPARTQTQVPNRRANATSEAPQDDAEAAHDRNSSPDREESLSSLVARVLGVAEPPPVDLVRMTFRPTVAFAGTTNTEVTIKAQENFPSDSRALFIAEGVHVRESTVVDGALVVRLDIDPQVESGEYRVVVSTSRRIYTAREKFRVGRRTPRRAA